MIEFLIKVFDNASGFILDWFARLLPHTFFHYFFNQHPEKLNQFVSVFQHVNYFLPLKEIGVFLASFTTFVVGYTVFRLIYVFVKGRLTA